MKKLTLLTLAAVAVLTMSGCTSKNDAERALTAQGFTNIEMTGYDFFSCGKDDFYHTGFKATNVKGQTVTGTVCSGLLIKNATIRY